MVIIKVVMVLKAVVEVLLTIDTRIVSALDIKL